MSLESEVLAVAEIVQPMLSGHSVYFSCTITILPTSDNVKLSWQATCYEPKLECKAPTLLACAEKFVAVYKEAIKAPEQMTVQLRALPAPAVVDGEVLKNDVGF